MSQNKSLKEARVRLDRKRAAYHALFSTPNGKVVLEDLRAAFGQSTLKKGTDGLDPYASIASAGSREVVLYIEFMMKESDSNATTE